MILIYGASANGFGDIGCDVIGKAKSREEAIEIICDEVEELFHPSYSKMERPSWLPTRDELKSEFEMDGRVVIGTDRSEADYDYIWKICDTEEI